MKTRWMIYLVMFLLISGCQGKMKHAEVSESKSAPDYISSPPVNDEAAKTETPVDATNQNPQPTNIPNPVIVQKMIKEADVRLEVKKYSLARPQIMAAIKKYNGFITSENQDNNEQRINTDYVIRVSNDKFDGLVDDLVATASHVNYKKIKAEDVSEEYVDIESRLKTKREVEKRYLDILSRAKTVDEILKVEETIRVIREEIEAKEGRMRFINDRVSFSTINLNVYEKLDFRYIPDSKPNFFQRLWKAINTGWTALITVLIALFYIWPLILIALIIVFIILRVERKRKKAKEVTK